MKIIELCTSKGWGGLELYALKVSEWLASQGHDCLVVDRPDSLIDKRLQDTGLSKTGLTLRLAFFPLLAARRLAKIVDQHQSDILHVHWNKDLILAVLARRLSKRKPKLVFIRHMALTRHKRDIYHRFIYHNIDAYLVITRRLQAEAEKFLPLDKNKIHLIYHGVGDSPQADEKQCQTFFADKGIDAQHFRVLLPGRIEHGKGQHVMLEALHQLYQEGIRIELALLGHIMDQNYFDGLQKQLSEWGLESHVHYLGFVENPVYIYNCFDLLALTTYAETFGLVLIEGMKSGVAVVGTDAGGVPEIIEHDKTGLLFEPGNAKALASCIRSLVEDDNKRNSLAKAGKAYADKVFSEGQHYSVLMNIFNKLI